MSYVFFRLSVVRLFSKKLLVSLSTSNAEYLSSIISLDSIAISFQLKVDRLSRVYSSKFNSSIRIVKSGFNLARLTVSIKWYSHSVSLFLGYKLRYS